jgi:hypothetical protein
VKTVLICVATILVYEWIKYQGWPILRDLL